MAAVTQLLVQVIAGLLRLHENYHLAHGQLPVESTQDLKLLLVTLASHHELLDACAKFIRLKKATITSKVPSRVTSERFTRISLALGTTRCAKAQMLSA